MEKPESLTKAGGAGLFGNYVGSQAVPAATAAAKDTASIEVNYISRIESSLNKAGILLINNIVLYLILSYSLTIYAYGEELINDGKTEIIGNWQIEDTRATGELIRQSGQYGVVRFFVAPLSNDHTLNGRFYVNCTLNGYFISVNLVNIVRRNNEEIVKMNIFVNGKKLVAVTSGQGNSIIENGMIKVPLNINDIEGLSNSNISIIVKSDLINQQYDFRMQKSADAFRKFERDCVIN